MLVNKKTIQFLAIFAFLQAFVLLFVYQKFSRANADSFSVLEMSNKSLENFSRQILERQYDLMTNFKKEIEKAKRGGKSLKLAKEIATKAAKIETKIDSLLQNLSSIKKVNYSAAFQHEVTDFYESVLDSLQQKNKDSSKLLIKEIKILQVEKIEFSEMTARKSMQEHRLFLNKMKANIGLTKLKTLSFLYENRDKPINIYTSFEPAVILSNGKRIEQGETLEAKIYLANFAKNASFPIVVNGDTLQINENGMAFYEKKADKIGTFPVKASIEPTKGSPWRRTITGEMEYKVKKACR